jgi:lysophospholipid acyltransferase (LPLAT)-like uncharacterized protein
MRAWWRRVRPGVLSSLIYILVRIIGFTLRLRAEGEEVLDTPGGKIVSGWHGRSFLAPLRWGKRGWWVLVSHSRDGEIMARLFQKFGFRVVRGSTGKGGARAAIECARALREGGTLIYSPDGPQGPTHIVQPGIMWLAQHGNAAIIPAAAVARPRKLASSWDSYQIPLPFGRGLLALGSPIFVPKDISDSEVEELRLKVQNAMNSIEDQSERDLGYMP